MVMNLKAIQNGMHTALTRYGRPSNSTLCVVTVTMTTIFHGRHASVAVAGLAVAGMN